MAKDLSLGVIGTVAKEGQSKHLNWSGRVCLGWCQDNGKGSNQESKFDFLATRQCLVKIDKGLGWRQDNGNRSNQESKFDFLATRKCLVKIDEPQQKIKIIRTNRQSNLRASCQSIFSLCRHHPNKGQQKNKIHAHQQTIKFTAFLPINFLPLPAPP